MVFHHHHIGSLIHQYYINTTNIPHTTTVRQKKYIRTEHIILKACLSSNPSDYYHLIDHHDPQCIPDGGGDCGGRVASRYGLLLGLRSMLVFDLLTVYMPVARGSSSGDGGGGYDSS